MKRSLLPLLALALLLPAMGGADKTADDSKTMTGEYEWSRSSRGPGELEAIFTPTGKGTWQVDFHFVFRGKPRVFSGTAEGSLTDGKLAGEVKNGNKNRTFTFEGETEGGVFRGTHAEIEDGYPEETGTLTLKL